MRDPWFPIALMLIVLIAIWLSIIGPMPDGFAVWLQHWQTLVAAGVASIAAFIAFRNTTRSLNHAERLEERRRGRKHAAVRAVLPLALAQVTAYAERSARGLNALVSNCDGETLQARAAENFIVESLPSDTLRTLSDFIEYSDHLNVEVIEATAALIQIHDSRLRGLVRESHEPMVVHVIVRTELENRIIDAASIYAGAASTFDYARRRQTQLPHTLTWDAVGAALRNMGFWDDEHPRLYENLSKREAGSMGPWERLTNK